MATGFVAIDASASVRDWSPLLYWAVAQSRALRLSSLVAVVVAGEVAIEVPVEVAVEVAVEAPVDASEAIAAAYSVAAAAAFDAAQPLFCARVLVAAFSDVGAAVCEAADGTVLEDAARPRPAFLAYLNAFRTEAGLRPFAREDVAIAPPHTSALPPTASAAATPVKFIPADASTSAVPHECNTVVLGGTFDHLHHGHLILLSTAAMLAKQTLICGVYDFANSPHRLERKAHWTHMEPLSSRIAAVQTFLRLFKPALNYRVEGILDDFGPTRTEADMDAIVASAETETGCMAVNALRKENGLPLLDVYVIGVVGNPDLHSSSGVGDKISSSYLRAWISEHEPDGKPNAS
ncbi:hypothetical protein BC830DRAFT_1153239 [Chytriomyces sp. MP71]|nr:hypothetical protein BC830DRAFT_1153239 [Chytriomyces sp. MP71]